MKFCQVAKIIKLVYGILKKKFGYIIYRKDKCFTMNSGFLTLAECDNINEQLFDFRIIEPIVNCLKSSNFQLLFQNTSDDKNKIIKLLKQKIQEDDYLDQEIIETTGTLNIEEFLDKNNNKDALKKGLETFIDNNIPLVKDSENAKKVLASLWKNDFNRSWFQIASDWLKNFFCNV